MKKIWPVALCSFALLAAGASPAPAAELRIGRDALERTLKQQLFTGPNGRFYLKGTPRSACSVYADDARVAFVQDRIVVKVKTRARMGKSVGGACIGISLSPLAEVSMAPYGEGESIGFRDAQLLRVSDQRELNFLLTPFLSRQVPSSMKVDAADLLRKALEGSTASSGYQVSLERLKVHSMQIQGDSLVVDVDGDISVK
ncbi:hypothetical protein [Occallatibacter savannae]|uniref:hypothetical protein n=1 Tax=Occallatibacter savannae TaxID=1002691 RepID=UPI000D68FEC2|nr:hypothetical protein [Occallatibacter savannae]